MGQILISSLVLRSDLIKFAAAEVAWLLADLLPGVGPGHNPGESELDA